MVSFLDMKGIPSPVERALICPPTSRLRPLDFEERDKVRAGSIVGNYYDNEIDRVSAYEKLLERAEQKEKEENQSVKSSRSRETNSASDIFGAAAKSAARSFGTQLGRQIIRGVLGSFFGKKR